MLATHQHYSLVYTAKIIWKSLKSLRNKKILILKKSDLNLKKIWFKLKNLIFNFEKIMIFFQPWLSYTESDNIIHTKP